MPAGSSPLERFIPDPGVRERFETTVRAPADLVTDVAAHFDMQSLIVVKAIFWLREKLMRASLWTSKAAGHSGGNEILGVGYPS